ncbi:hypothetical protein AUEXF2481DRAFT_403252 [Aureobasidium subglaciale EXF-2481]|uniref:Secreted protein n=1 Tax=Aureobasidium subglaciale (strain EXF-2481) TaxID=1043005 RepID=A0A074ZLA0_AURSE|nr:uncharacterized protein AUEXF2481DRAFT_403252 [Aureobasidium subglaciale EXF-2481]KEQ99176.1 hypothetical protein AUEXF2481DRAFT_403252 [Aureobasidium subglaciale EXF-2481]
MLRFNETVMRLFFFFLYHLPFSTHLSVHLTILPARSSIDMVTESEDSNCSYLSDCESSEWEHRDGEMNDRSRLGKKRKGDICKVTFKSEWRV